jgi:hypothetical protein
LIRGITELIDGRPLIVQKGFSIFERCGQHYRTPQGRHSHTDLRKD